MFKQVCYNIINNMFKQVFQKTNGGFIGWVTMQKMQNSCYVW